jgi:acyl carrier protein
MTRERIESWLTTRLAARLSLQPAEIDIYRPLDELGLDSMEAVALTGELERFLGRRVEPTVLWDHRTIVALSHFLSGDGTVAATGVTDTMTDAEVDALLRKLNSAAS